MLDIVVPVFNEGANIEAFLHSISDCVPLSKTVYIVYDFDEDNTVEVVLKIQHDFDFQIKLIKNTLGRGVLNAIKTGFENSTSEIILVAMGDLSDSLEVVNQMYEKISKEGYDVVCGSRYMKGGKQFGGPLLKCLFSRIAGVSLHYLIRIPTHDITNNFKMYRRNVITDISIESHGGFEIGMEITIKAFIRGYRIAEVPSYWHDRSNGKSNFKMWKWLPQYLRWYKWGIFARWFGTNDPLSSKKLIKRNIDHG